MPDLGVVLTILHTSVQFRGQTARVKERLVEAGDALLQEMVTDLRSRIVATTPVDTGRLQGSWSPATRRQALLWGTGTDLYYAPILEYGGYTRTGPRTVALGGGDLGEGFVAGGGIYSTQAPLGFVRKAIVQTAPVLRTRLAATVASVWALR